MSTYITAAFLVVAFVIVMGLLYGIGLTGFVTSVATGVALVGGAFVVVVKALKGR